MTNTKTHTNVNNEIKELTDFLDKYGVKYRVVGDRVESDIVLLSHKAITQLPDSIGKLKCKYLSLINNNLTSLPDSFCEITCEDLSLSNNNLTSLPDGFGSLKCKYLWLDYNRLTQLPDSFGKLKCTLINLLNNKINSLPDSFGKLKCKYLYLDSNLTCKFMNVNASEWSKANGLARYKEGTQFRHITCDCVTCSQYISDDGVKHYEFFNAKTHYKIDDFSSSQMQAVEKILYYILSEDK